MLTSSFKHCFSPRRWIASATTPLAMPLHEFRDQTSREKRMQEKVGRSWSARELRRKSYDDLHKLWHVLYKERNMLLTELQLSQRHQIVMPQPERIQKVKKSMGAIRQVLGERKKEKLAQHALKRAALEEMERGNVIMEKETDYSDVVDDKGQGEITP